MKISLSTYIDITCTKTTHRRRPEENYTDAAGQLIDSDLAWHRSRNQQRNWETVIQLLGLRTQPQELQTSAPGEHQGRKAWRCVFEVEQGSVYHDGEDALGYLKQDFDRVPVLIGLGEDPPQPAMFVCAGPDANVFFSQETDK